MIEDVLPLLTDGTLRKMIENLTKYRRRLSEEEREDVDISIAIFTSELLKRKENDNDLFDRIS